MPSKLNVVRSVMVGNVFAILFNVESLGFRKYEFEQGWRVQWGLDIKLKSNKKSAVIFTLLLQNYILFTILLNLPLTGLAVIFLVKLY